ncbi:hypothetical protein RUND412_001357 [Rhizina undulata]
MDDEAFKKLEAATANSVPPGIEALNNPLSHTTISDLDELEALLSEASGVPARSFTEIVLGTVTQPYRPHSPDQQVRQAQPQPEQQGQEHRQENQADDVADYVLPPGELSGADAEEVFEALKTSLGQSALEAILKEIELESKDEQSECDVFPAPADEWEAPPNAPPHNEASLSELQKTIEQLSQPATRANSPPVTSTVEPSPRPTAHPVTSSSLVNAGGNVQTTPQDINVNTIDFSKIPRDIASITNWLADQVNKVRSSNVSASGSVGAPGNTFLVPNGIGRRKGSLAADPNKVVDKGKVRQENRERKKRWREVNQDRNKDNDLRCRVTKRAGKLFGEAPSVEKTQWMANEFDKRKEKRLVKEKARDGGDNGMLAIAGSSSVFPAYQPAGATHSSAMGQNRGHATFYNSHPIQEANANAELIQQQLLNTLSQNPGLLNQLQALLAATSETAAPSGVADVPIVSDAATSGGNGWNTEDLSGLEGLEGLADIDANNIGIGVIDDLVASVEQALQAHDVDPSVSGTSKSSTDATASNASTKMTLCVGESSEMKHESHGNSGSMESSNSEDSTDTTLASVIRGIFGPQVDLEKLVVINDDGDLQFAEEELVRLCHEANIDLNDLDLEGLMVEASADASAEVSHASSRDTSPSVQPDASDAVRMGENGDVVMTDSQPQESNETDLDPMTDIEIGNGQSMTLEQINAMIGELVTVTGTVIPDEVGVPAPAPLQGPNIPAASPTQSANAAIQPQPSANAEDYTAENFAAIINALISTSPSPPPPPSDPAMVAAVPPPPPFRGVKRPAVAYTPSPHKRARMSPPNMANGMNATTAAAANQLNQLFESNGFGPITQFHGHTQASHMSSNAKDAYAASFGNSDAMNKRLMKPPPYRPGGVGAGSMSSVPGGIGVVARKKSGEDEKKIKAMGFPPLMAGMKRA